MPVMIIDGTFPSEVSDTATSSERAVASFLHFFEKKLDVKFVRYTHGVPEEMLAPLRLAELLRANGIIKGFARWKTFPDEMPMKSWIATCNDETSHNAAGSSWESDPDALMAALAEALERYVWFTQTDYFTDPHLATEEAIQKFGAYIPLERFAGFSHEQRAKDPGRLLRKDVEYLWVRAISLVQGKHLYIPAQVVSAARLLSANPANKEPQLRPRTTIGLATWPTKTGARLAGALEAIERDAYMVTWLNQLTLTRISLDSLRSSGGALANLLEKCERYRFKPHVVKLLTDAPTHAVMVVLEDISGLAPRFSIGIRTHRSLSSAVLKAFGEAARSHLGYRSRQSNGVVWDEETPTEKIGHRERVEYWGVPKNAKHLEFLVQGIEEDAKAAVWENDSEEEHLSRIIEWCRSSCYECLSVSVGASAKNPTAFHIEQVVMPELQPAYLTEATQTFGGSRWKDVPAKFGIPGRKEPFAERPHPFS